MKKFGKFYRNPAKRRAVRKRNPVPYALTVINPAKKRSATKRRRRKNPSAITRKVGQSKWHHKRGLYRYNPAKKRRKRRNPLEIRHVIEDVPSRNPFRKKRRKTKKSANKNPTMSKTRKRRRKARRNPAKSIRRRSSSRRRRRNPSRRSLFRRMRNPVPIISDVFTKDNITQGAGVLVGVVGTRWLVNTLINGNATTGARLFNLPGITYSTAAAPLTQAQFTATNKIALAFYEAALPAVVGWLLRNQSRAFATGVMQASVVNLGIAAIRATSVGTTAGMGAFLPRGRGAGTFIPGVPPMLSGPATSFINTGSPMPSRRANGMGATVNGRWHNQTVTGGANPFKKN